MMEAGVIHDLLSSNAVTFGNAVFYRELMDLYD